MKNSFGRTVLSVQTGNKTSMVQILAILSNIIFTNNLEDMNVINVNADPYPPFNSMSFNKLSGESLRRLLFFNIFNLLV